MEPGAGPDEFWKSHLKTSSRFCAVSMPPTTGSDADRDIESLSHYATNRHDRRESGGREKVIDLKDGDLHILRSLIGNWSRRPSLLNPFELFLHLPRGGALLVLDQACRLKY